MNTFDRAQIKAAFTCALLSRQECNNSLGSICIQVLFTCSKHTAVQKPR